MATNWDLYNTRLNINGSTQRDRTINNFKTMKDTIGINSPASKTVSMEKIDKSAFADMKVFINSKTNKFEKSISPVMSTDILILGNKVKWKNYDWLITDLNLDDDVFVDGTMRLCNYTLPFQTTSSTIISEPCIVLTQSEYTSGENQGNVITLSDSQRAILIQYNENTKYLIEQKRLFIDQLCDKPKVYKITKADRIYYMNGTNGLLKLTCDEDQTVGANDNVALKIADYISTDPSPTPVPTTLGTANIASTKNVIYTASVPIKVGSTGTSAKPFVAKFFDTSKTEILGLTSKWSLVLPSALTDKVTLTYNATYPNRCYVNVVNENSIIGESFELHLIDVGSLYGECFVKCQVVNLYG